MRIAMIGHKRIPSRDGGVEVAVGMLSARMAALGHDVTVYNRGTKGAKIADGAEAADCKGVHIKNSPALEKRGLAAVTGSFTATLSALFCCMNKKTRYDCIHYHAEGPAAMAFLPHLFGIRTVVTIHGLDWKRSKWGRFASWYLRMGEKIAARYADEVIVLSRAMQDYFRETYGRETVYIPNGIEAAEVCPADEITARWGLKKDSYLLFLGRIVPEKGIAALIDAFRDVKTDKKLVIAGGASDTEAFFAEMKQKVADDDRILFTGFAVGRTLAELFSNCYLYCLPSELEGMPISLLEALSHGCACVTSDIPECTEVTGDNGICFPRGDTDALRSVLQTLCDDHAAVSLMRSKTAARAAEMYDWDETVRRTVAVYEGNI